MWASLGPATVLVAPTPVEPKNATPSAARRLQASARILVLDMSVPQDRKGEPSGWPDPCSGQARSACHDRPDRSCSQGRAARRLRVPPDEKTPAATGVRSAAR